MKENKVIDVSSGVSPLGPSNRVKASLRKAIKKINIVPSEGSACLKRFFESKFGLFPENMLFANSLKELVWLVPAVFKPRKVLIVGPALNMYEDASVFAGAEVSYINAAETDGFSPDISLIHNNLKGIDLVFIANPNRISGEMVPREDISEAVAVSGAGGPHFVVDESLIDFTGDNYSLNDVLSTGNLTVLRTTAFFYGVPGLELAYAVSSPENIALYQKNIHWQINPLAARAAETAYKDSTYIKALGQFINTEKKLIIRKLNKIDWIKIYDTDTNVILIRINNNPEEVAKNMKRAGLDIKDCREIKGLDRTYLRLSVMKHQNNLKLISALSSI